MVYRCIAPKWLLALNPNLPPVKEGEFDEDTLKDLNKQGYNIYFLPNFPSIYDPATPVTGAHIDTFNWVFVDMDLKEGKWASKQEFVDHVKVTIEPTFIVDSGNGIHAYWQVTDLDVGIYLRLQRRLLRYFNTDESLAKIYQLMRMPNSFNTKDQNNFKPCEVIFDSPNQYTAEEMDKLLPTLSAEDEEYCQQHYNKTYGLNQQVAVDEKIPLKFAQLLKSNKEVKEIWSGNLDDRSKGDYRLGHLMFANGFTKDEAMSVLVNSAKALSRAPVHRVNYAQNIVEKIWIYELADNKEELILSNTVKDILSKYGTDIKGTRFPCWSYIDATEHGFRLGQVIGLVAGSGVGKTAVALNMFRGFVKNNPDYDHFFVPLEQPANEIAERWQSMCQDDPTLNEKVHVVSNYDEQGNFRHLSFDEIKDYILKFQQVTKRKVGAVVIDHIGALKKKDKKGENQDLMDICHAMKAFAVQTNTMLIMQSQAPREKAGIGDLELNKDAAYGTVYFESYCDYLITIWQPLKRCYNEPGCPTVTAFKFCKIRHKKTNKDQIIEDVCYKLYFDPNTQHLRELTQDEETSFTFFLNKATNKRKTDRKTDLVPYESIKWSKGDTGV